MLQAVDLRVIEIWLQAGSALSSRETSPHRWTLQSSNLGNGGTKLDRPLECALSPHAVTEKTHRYEVAEHKPVGRHHK